MSSGLSEWMVNILDARVTINRKEHACDYEDNSHPLLMFISVTGSVKDAGVECGNPNQTFYRVTLLLLLFSSPDFVASSKVAPLGETF